jgi:hypothetical protein
VDDYNYWQYVPAENRYQRYQEVDDQRGGKAPAYAPLTDALTGLPVMADNVVVLFVQHRFANKFNEEDEVYHIDVYGSGNAYVFQGWDCNRSHLEPGPARPTDPADIFSGCARLLETRCDVLPGDRRNVRIRLAG